MELRYPWAIAVIAVMALAAVGAGVAMRKRKGNFAGGSKIANTQFVQQSEYYQRKMRRYRALRGGLWAACGVAVAVGAVLMARPARVENVNVNQYNRDIMLCMDASGSVDELNLELVEKLKNTVDRLRGERFGVSIFNTTSVLLVPLTDDYDYVKGVLDEIRASIVANNDPNIENYSGDDFYTREYINSGTLEESETRGSSLIGDGLASCVYDFAKLEDERTRIIIFSTDNDLAGTPLVTLGKAAEISRSKGVKVFGVGTEVMRETDRAEMKAAVERTGGKFYEHSATTVNSIIDDIEATSKSLLDDQHETKVFDVPQVPFVLLVVAVAGIVLITGRMRE